MKRSLGKFKIYLFCSCFLFVAEFRDFCWDLTLNKCVLKLLDFGLIMVILLLLEDYFIWVFFFSKRSIYEFYVFFYYISSRDSDLGHDHGMNNLMNNN